MRLIFMLMKQSPRQMAGFQSNLSWNKFSSTLDLHCLQSVYFCPSVELFVSDTKHTFFYSLQTLRQKFRTTALWHFNLKRPLHYFISFSIICLKLLCEHAILLLVSPFPVFMLHQASAWSFRLDIQRLACWLYLYQMSCTPSQPASPSRPGPATPGRSFCQQHP